jgi:hypothetical protein
MAFMTNQFVASYYMDSDTNRTKFEIRKKIADEYVAYPHIYISFSEANVVALKGLLNFNKEIDMEGKEKVAALVEWIFNKIKRSDAIMMSLIQHLPIDICEIVCKADALEGSDPQDNGV